MEDYLAHIAEDGRTQTVQEHLEGTARLAACFADAFSSREYGYFVGMAHDIGKCTLGFQRRLQGGPIVDHSSAGAKACFDVGKLFSALCVAGHHGGMADFGNPTTDSCDDATFAGRIKKCIETPPLTAWRNVLPPCPEEPFEQDWFARSLWCRMLYSCLVDADFLDTERFMSPKTVARGGYESLETLAVRLEDFLKKWD